MVEGDAALARREIDMNPLVNESAEAASTHEVARLIAREPNRLLAYRIETEMFETLKRIYYRAKRMSRALVRAAGADAD